MDKKQGKKKLPKKLHRDYGMIINSSIYNRNWGFKYHDNAYGINGGGDGAARKKADKALYAHMIDEQDPMASIVYICVRVFGWSFFNYRAGAPLGLWRGQLIKKLFPKYRAK